MQNQFCLKLRKIEAHLFKKIYGIKLNKRFLWNWIRFKFISKEIVDWTGNPASSWNSICNEIKTWLCCLYILYIWKLFSHVWMIKMLQGLIGWQWWLALGVLFIVYHRCHWYQNYYGCLEKVGGGGFLLLLHAEPEMILRRTTLLSILPPPQTLKHTNGLHLDDGIISSTDSPHWDPLNSNAVYHTVDLPPLSL